MTKYYKIDKEIVDTVILIFLLMAVGALAGYGILLLQGVVVGEDVEEFSWECIEDEIKTEYKVIKPREICIEKHNQGFTIMGGVKTSYFYDPENPEFIKCVEETEPLIKKYQKKICIKEGVVREIKREINSTTDCTLSWVGDDQ